MTGPEWRLYAACRDADPRIFFPEIIGRGCIERELKPVAETYCRPCPVRDECRREARRVADEHLAVHGLWHGVWYRRLQHNVDLLATPEPIDRTTT